MSSLYTYTYTQGATPSQWSDASTYGPSGSPFNCYPSPTSSITITYTFLAAASGCPIGYAFSSDSQDTTISTCILTEGLVTPETYTWDCVFTVGESATSYVDGGTTTIGDGSAQTITAAPETITVTQTAQQTTTATSVVDPGAETVTITSIVTQGASKRRSQAPVPGEKYGAIYNFNNIPECEHSNTSSPLAKRYCDGYQCSDLCCGDGETCVGDGHYCCPGYGCVDYDPSDPFDDYSASWLYFTAPIRTYTTTDYDYVTTYETSHVASDDITVTPTSTEEITVTNVQTVSVTTTLSDDTVTLTVFSTLVSGGAIPTNPGPPPTDSGSSPSNIVSTTLIPVVSTSGSSVPLKTTSVSVVTVSSSSITHAPVARWTGSGNLLNGYCVTPDYVLLDGATAYWAPFVGCDSHKTDCCPFDVATTVAAAQNYPVAASTAQATLSQCPDDYESVLSGCCPSGYILWNTPLGGQIPCFSTLTSYLTPPPIPITARAETTPKATLAVENVVYAMYYPVQAPPSAGLSTGAKAGIGAGAGVAGLAIIALLALLIRTMRRGKKDHETVSVLQSPQPESVMRQSTHPSISQYSPPNHQGLEPYGNPVPLGGYLPQDQPDYAPRPAYQSWPPVREQHWQTSQGIYPSPPTSSASPPPGSPGYSSQASYQGQPNPSELQVVHERQELLAQSYLRNEMSG